MPTIETTPSPATPTRHRSRRGRRRQLPVPLPVVAVGVLAVLVAWRFAGPSDPAPAAREVAAPPTVARAFGDLQVDTPRGWTALERTDAHAAWGTADRSHTVTLAQTEASSAPLPGVVAEVARQAADVLPGARLVGEPRAVELVRAPRGDTAMMVRFEVARADASPLRVEQVWRRDERAAVDLVATWTSTDGTWPLEPASAPPRVGAARSR